MKVLLLLNPESAEELLTESFLSSTLAAMREDPNNNILHNYQKDVVLSGISESNRVNELLQNEMRFDETLRSNLSEGNSRVSYESQLFLIGEAIKIKSEEGSAICNSCPSQPKGGTNSRKPSRTSAPSTQSSWGGNPGAILTSGTTLKNSSSNPLNKRVRKLMPPKNPALSMSW